MPQSQQPVVDWPRFLGDHAEVIGTKLDEALANCIGAGNDPECSYFKMGLTLVSDEANAGSSSFTAQFDFDQYVIPPCDYCGRAHQEQHQMTVHGYTRTFCGVDPNDSACAYRYFEDRPGAFESEEVFRAFQRVERQARR